MACLRRSSCFARLIAAVLLEGIAAQAAVRPASYFSDHMVIQADQVFGVWGQAAPGEAVTVTFAGHRAQTTAGADGNWRLEFPACPPSGEPQEMTISAENRIVLHDVLVGEVWLVSGQSNMAWLLRDDVDHSLEHTWASGSVRQFTVRRTIASEPARSVEGEWIVADARTVARFSAVAWHFAQAVHRATGVPVAILNATWGNTPIAAWLPREAAPPAATATEPYQAPAALFNGMIHPLTPAAIRGMLWYQGESDVERASAYAPLFADLITRWRAAFGRPDLPFYWVQLPAFRGGDAAGHQWPSLREAQAEALNLPGTGQAVTIDLGDPDDIHPRKKREVGLRLARLALNRIYGSAVPDTGPVFSGAEFSGSTVRVRFRFATPGLLRSPLAALDGFELAGADRVFHAATGRIEQDAVEVSSAAVTDPIAVRYAWRNLARASLFDSHGLPAAPFRSDDW